MKDQATHIRLIRKDGKPVEAEYTNPHWNITRYPLKDWKQFKQWAEANRIPVTGDWPADKEVFAMSEVEEVGQVYLTWLGEWVSPSRWLFEKRAVAGEKTRTALRLKATLSDDRQSEVTDYRERYKKIAESDSFKAAYNDRSLGEAIRVEGEVTVKEVCNHEPLVDTGVEYYHCPACNQGWKYDDWKSAKEKRFQQGEELFEPKQEAKTEEEIMTDNALSDYTDPDNGKRLLIFNPDGFYKSLEAYKQQYQQAIIEKIDEEIERGNLQKNAPVVYGAYRRCQQIIQSTK